MPAASSGTPSNGKAMRPMFTSHAPFRPALFEKRTDALARFAAGARFGKHARGDLTQLRRNRRLRDLAQELLRTGQRAGPALGELLREFFHASVEFGCRYAGVRETEALRLPRREAFPAKHVPASLLFP